MNTLPVIVDALVPVAITLAQQGLPLLVGGLSSLIAKGLERAPVFPYEGKTREGVIKALGIPAFGLTVLLAWASGNLDTVDTAHGASVIIGTLEALLAAAGGYALVKFKSSK